MSNKEWQIDTRLLDSGNEPVKACFDFGSSTILADGKLRFEFVIRTDVGDFTLRGFRYDSETDQLLLPSYRAGKGWQPLVKLDGPIFDELCQRAKQLASQLVESEPVEAGSVETAEQVQQ